MPCRDVAQRMGIEFSEARNKLKVANQRQTELGQSQAKLSEVCGLLPRSPTMLQGASLALHAHGWPASTVALHPDTHASLPSQHAHSFNLGKPPPAAGSLKPHTPSSAFSPRFGMSTLIQGLQTCHKTAHRHAASLLMRINAVQNLALERKGHESTREQLSDVQDKLARTLQEASSQQAVATQVCHRRLNCLQHSCTSFAAMQLDPGQGTD